MENFCNNSLLWKTHGQGAERSQEPRARRPSQTPRPPRGRSPRTGQPRGPLAYSPMSLSCAGWMRGGDGDSTSPPVTVA